MTEVLRDVLLSRAASNPDGVAYSFGAAQLTFGELAERAAGRAVMFQREGVGPGDHVAVVMSSGLPFVEVFWGLQLIGGVPCAFNPAVPSDTLARRVAVVRPTLVVTDDSASALSSNREPSSLPAVSPDDLAFLQLTSGTSGKPRAAMIRHRNVLAYERTTTHLVPSDVAVSWMPPWHDFGLVTFIISSAYAGVPLHLLAPSISSFPEWLATITRVGGTVTGGPDFAFRIAARIVKPAGIDLSTLRVAMSGGEPIRRSSIEQFEGRFTAPGIVVPSYGLAEATVGVTMHPPGEERIVDARGNVSCGPARWGFELRAGHDVDHPSEIVARGEPVFAGYLDAPEDTAKVLRDGWLHTGDSGYLDDAGRLYVLGRRASMIKRGGAVVAPRELEEAAQRVDCVRVAAATSVPAPDQDGELIVVAVEADDSLGRSSGEIAREVSGAITARLGFAPGRIDVLPKRSIPRTENGKIRYERLRVTLLERSA